MCGRFAQPRSSEELARLFRARAAARLEGEQYNVAPTDEVSAVLERGGERLVDAFRWGLVPHWARDASGAARHINARAETVDESPTYRVAFRSRRCIVPADAFYEWRRDVDWPRGVGQRRPGRGAPPQPFAIERRDGEPMALAGLWAVWRDAEGFRLPTVTILTTEPNAVVAQLHNRMPVILHPWDWDAWLDPAADPDELRPLLAPAADELLGVRPVSPAVNDVRNEGPQLLATWAVA